MRVERGPEPVQLVHTEAAGIWSGCLSAGELKVQQSEVPTDGDAVFVTQEVAPDGDGEDFSREGEEGL